jgi:hypothetical protein
VGDAECEDDEFSVLDGVDDAVVTDPDTPKVGEAREDPGAGRAGIGRQAFNRAGDASSDLAIELGQLLDGSRVVLNG